MRRNLSRASRGDTVALRGTTPPGDNFQPAFFLLQIQIYGFNAELYHNMSEAQHKSQGLVAISLMVQVSEFFIERSLGESSAHFSNCSNPRKFPAAQLPRYNLQLFNSARH